MLLYKYLDSERIDVLSNKTIRFSQPDSFNDVFECRPFFSDLGCTIEYLKTIGQKELSEYKLSEAEKKNLIDEILSPDIVAERFPKICEFMRYIFANTTGVLSLTENPYSLLMWAHYAENHKGYVIGFDSENDFFNRYNTGVNYTLGQLNKVHYTNRRPKVGLSKVELAELYFTKSNDWEYEKEWRFFLNLMDADRIIETEPYPICLFSFPANLIKKVILGVRMTKENITQVLSILNTEQYQHVKVYKAELDEQEYKIIINELSR